MFLYDLSPEQRRAFPVLAAAVIHADGAVAREEQEVMARLDAELGVRSADMPPMREALAAFDSASSRRAALIELIGIAWCDGDMADAEAALIDEVAAEWMIGGEVLAAMIDWMSRQTALLAEAAHLIRG